MGTTATSQSNPDAAVSLALQGTPVFPCRPDNKRPLVEGGFYAATTDLATIKAWWQQYPDALIGVPTGERTGFDVLDSDPRHGGDAWLQAHAAAIPPTRTHATRSGGRHLLFKHQPGLRCSADTTIGIDVRADLGYIVHWPSHGFDIQAGVIADWPVEVLSQITSKQCAARETGKDPSELAPPDADTVVALLNRMPNPLEIDRDQYVQIMLAARGRSGRSRRRWHSRGSD